MTKDPIKDIIKRLERLEKAFGAKHKKPDTKSASEDFSGPSGGIRLLASKGFFRSKKNLNSVREALGKEGYHYRASAVQTALNRFSARGELLTSSKEGGKKIYVERK